MDGVGYRFMDRCRESQISGNEPSPFSLCLHLQQSEVLIYFLCFCTKHPVRCLVPNVRPETATHLRRVRICPQTNSGNLGPRGTSVCAVWSHQMEARTVHPKPCLCVFFLPLSSSHLFKKLGLVMKSDPPFLPSF